MPLLVTAAVIFEKENVLITRRPMDKVHAGLWEFPGGKVDPGESPEEALCREIREELDVEIRVKGIFEVAFYRYDWGPVLILAYSCQLLTADLCHVGVADHRWDPSAGAGELLYPPRRPTDYCSPQWSVGPFCSFIF